MSKQSIIVLLVGLNLILLATLILFTYAPPQAMAQAAPLGQNYVMVAGQIRSGMDALYVIDLAHRRLHVFLPNRDQANRRIFYEGYRDLQKEFRGGR
ncbi:MAG: hypothetical protein DCC65_14205 [Planctomycetota bacterium]|nr:MAG: hypothetical protein DCC65_14205 [Planctomycetota bacterium]